MSTADQNESGGERLHEVIAGFLEQAEAGQQPDREQLLEENVEIADELRVFFDDHDRMHQLAGPVTARPDDPQRTKPASSPSGSSPARPGTVLRYFGDYELLEEIARGGMGVVYKARQVRLNRIVAVKMILSGDLASTEDVRRFHSEAEAAAKLSHPGIVPIYEVGEHEGQHFYSMGFVEGESLSRQINQSPLSALDAARLIRQAALAVQYAHVAGVIHRDLKPANILIDGDGQPLVTDFGLAKQIEVDRSLTPSGDVIGTPSWMPPEQALGQTAAVREPADIYSLGAVLYAALTGRAPFQTDNTMDTLLQVIEREPVPPRQLNPAVPIDLETICLKCLQKERRRRYGSMQELADELQRFLDGRPILARPLGRIARTARWCQRNPLIASLAVLLIASLAGGTIASTIFAMQASDRAERAEELKTLADQSASNALLSAENERKARLAEAEARTEAEQRALSEVEAHERAETQKTEAQRATAELLLRRGLELCDRGEIDAGLLWMARVLELDPAATADLQTTARLNIGAWQLELLTLTDIQQLEGEVAAITPDGRLIAAREYNYQKANPRGLWVRVWNVDDAEWQTERLKHPEPVTTIDFSSTGNELITITRGRKQRRWEVETGRLIETADAPDVSPVPMPEENRLLQEVRGRFTSRRPMLQVHAERSPDALHILTTGNGHEFTSSSGVAQLWGVHTRQSVGQPLRHQSAFGLAHFMDDGKRLLTGDRAGTVRIWQLPNDPLTRPIRSQAGNAWVSSVAVSQTGQTAAIGRVSGEAVLWNLKTGQTLGLPMKHQRAVWDIAFTPDGQNVVTGSHDATVRMWNATTGEPVGEPIVHDGSRMVWAVAVSPDGSTLATGTGSGGIGAAGDNSLRFFDLKSRERIGDPIAFPEGVRDIAFNADGTLLATACQNGTVRLWNSETHKPVGEPLQHSRDVRAVAFSHDGKLLATGSEDGTGRLWNVEALQPVGPALVHRRAVSSVAFGPNGQFLTTACHDGTVRLWSVATGHPIGPPFRHKSQALAVVFSINGQSLLSGGADRMAHLWNMPMLQNGESKTVVGKLMAKTGMRLGEDGRLTALSRERWLTVDAVERRDIEHRD